MAGGAMKSTRRVALRELAHGRAGDKGDRSNISVIAYDSAMYATLVEQVTEHRVARLFEHRRPTSVKRYLLPKLSAMNFVIDGVLDGGVNGSLNLDAHGKSLAFLVLGMEITMEGPEEKK
jgi:hypothetical protein